MRKKGILACALIKKRIYWPSMVPGKDMKDNFMDVEVGETTSIQGTVDDSIYNLWGMKEPNYLMRVKDTGVRLLVDDIYKETVIKCKENGEDVVKKFKYKLPFDWYFHYRHLVDDHDNIMHVLSSIEYKWMADRWECQVFAFILAISEVNAFLILRYFVYCGLRR